MRAGNYKKAGGSARGFVRALTSSALFAWITRGGIGPVCPFCATEVIGIGRGLCGESSGGQRCSDVLSPIIASARVRRWA